MMHHTRLFTLILALALGLSPHFISAQWFDTFFGDPVEQCPDDCPLQHYSSTYGAQCTDECATRGYHYYWCNTASGWDYCSPRQNTDYNGNACREDHYCDYHGYNYNWCYLEKGSWDKCGRVEVRPKHQTTNMQNCIDACQYYVSGGYYWCHTVTSWDYCSPAPDVTYRYSCCRRDHPCGNYGEKYRWCYTSYGNDWDYCGITSPAECSNILSCRWNWKTGSDDSICKKPENNGKVIVFKIEGDPDVIADCSGKLHKEALCLIARWEDISLGYQPRSNLIHSTNLRIDLQGLFTRDNRQYYNLQIQINEQRRPRRSTTVSQILVPVDTSEQDMRDAFQYSLQLRRRIALEVQEPTTILTKPKCCKHRIL